MMYEIEALDVAEVAHRTGLSETEILNIQSEGKIVFLREVHDTGGALTECEFIGIREAARRAGLSESTIRNYADSDKIFCVRGSGSNTYRSVWTTDVAKLRTRRR